MRHEMTHYQVYKVEDLLTKLELGCLSDASEKFFATQCNSKEAVAQLKVDKQISKFGAKLLSDCLVCPGDLGNRPAIIIYMEGIIKFTKLRPGERNKGPSCLQVKYYTMYFLYMPGHNLRYVLCD